MEESQKKIGVSPVYILITAIVAVSVTGFVIKYVSDGQNEIDDELSRQEDLVAKSNIDIIKNVGKDKQGGEDVLESWQTYRNKEYGFEVEYPGYFPVNKTFPPDEGGNFSCGKQLGDSFRAASSEHSNPTIFDFTVYSNPQKLAAKEFFLCLMKTAREGGFSEKEINYIKTVDVGNQKATSIAWDIASTTVLVPHGDKFIEIEWQRGQSSEANPGEFDQMLSTFRLIGTRVAVGEGNNIGMRQLDLKEYTLATASRNFIGGQPTVKEIMNCVVPDLSKKCPDPRFIGKENCNNITHAPADCAYEGTIAKSVNPTCVYNEFEGYAAGTVFGGFDGLVVNDSRCFLIHWDLTYPNCEISGNNCSTEKARRETDNDQMLSTFKFIEQ